DAEADPNTDCAQPSNVDMIRWLVPVIIKRAGERLGPRSRQHWRLATRIGHPRPLDGQGPVDMSGFRVHESPKGHFYADPFVVEYQGKNWLFFEDFLYVRRKGVLACAELLPDGSLSAARVVLERPYHLSYPCVFEADGALYMIPESLDNGAVDLYRCASFPDRWELVTEIMRAATVDSTIFKRDGHYWLWTSPCEPHANAKQLCLFLAPDLL